MFCRSAYNYYNQHNDNKNDKRNSDDSDKNHHKLFIVLFIARIPFKFAFFCTLKLLAVFFNHLRYCAVRSISRFLNFRVEFLLVFLCRCLFVRNNLRFNLAHKFCNFRRIHFRERFKICLKLNKIRLAI